MTITFDVDLDQLRGKEYHRVLARNLCIAFTASRMGISFKSAEKYVPEEKVGDSYLVAAHFLTEQFHSYTSRLFPTTREDGGSSIQ